MFRLPFGERVDPLEEKRQARENTINSVIIFGVLCAAIRIVVAVGNACPTQLVQHGVRQQLRQAVGRHLVRQQRAHGVGGGRPLDGAHHAARGRRQRRGGRLPRAVGRRAQRVLQHGRHDAPQQLVGQLQRAQPPHRLAPFVRHLGLALAVHRRLGVRVRLRCRELLYVIESTDLFVVRAREVGGRGPLAEGVAREAVAEQLVGRRHQRRRVLEAEPRQHVVERPRPQPAAEQTVPLALAPRRRRLVRPQLVDRHRPWRHHVNNVDSIRDGGARHPAGAAQLDHVAQHEADPGSQLPRRGQRLDTREVLVHQTAAALRVQHTAAGAHELRQAFQILVMLGGRAPRQQVLDAAVAFSKMSRITPFSTLSESSSRPSKSSLSFWNFSGVNLFRMPRTFRKMPSYLASASAASWSRSDDGGTQRRLGGTAVRPAARGTGPGCRALSVLRPVCSSRTLRDLPTTASPRTRAADPSVCVRVCRGGSGGAVRPGWHPPADAAADAERGLTLLRTMTPQPPAPRPHTCFTPRPPDSLVQRRNFDKRSF
ncbi:unnamed protein product [Leptidea sinapis]|uniref:Uncharacterized protein n=1 Tax=Leptidea sinapis TaxID=189913 RepID=A0A5E4QX40_9NEOP|nr:unnamed protein product [Leptidea sinapis]